MPRAFLFTALVLTAACVVQWLARRLAGTLRRPDGAPSRVLVRLSASAQILVAAPALAAILFSGGRLVPLRYLQFGEPLPALLIGVLGGLFLHLIGGGSPLPLAALRAAPENGAHARSHDPDAAAVLLFLAGIAAQEVIWRGIILGGLALALPGVAALLLSAVGYGFQRHLACEDNFVLAAMDGILLGVMARLAGSLLAAVVAHLIADLFAYASAADQSYEDSGLRTQRGLRSESPTGAASHARMPPLDNRAGPHPNPLPGGEGTSRLYP